MKNLMKFSWMVIALFLAACSGTRTGSEDSRSVEVSNDRNPNTIVVDHPQSLADILMRVPGVFVDESAFGTRVTIRGEAPLFVIDGVPVGHSYASAANALSVHDISSVEVLKSPTETAMYGLRGQNGVIVIRTGWLEE